MSFATDKSQEASVTTLLDMLTYRRCADSEGELDFIDRFIAPLVTHPNVSHYSEDAFGNIYVCVGQGSKTLFTAHTDTMHSALPGVKQDVIYDANLGLVYKDGPECLGADDGAGIWMLLQIIEANIPCWMVFFRMEEKGGKGSLWASDNNREWFEQFDQAIAFDRRGTGDVITEQMTGPCASKKWAQALSDQLNAHGLDYAPCPTGVFTDTANLAHIIPECSNISVGYDHEHRPEETQDVFHLLALRDAVVAIGWSSLPIKRDPEELVFWNSLMLGGYGLANDDEPTISVADLYDMGLEDLEDAAHNSPNALARAVFDLLWGEQ